MPQIKTLEFKKLKLVDYSNSDVVGQTNKIQFLLFQRPLLSYQNVPLIRI